MPSLLLSLKKWKKKQVPLSNRLGSTKRILTNYLYSLNNTSSHSRSLKKGNRRLSQEALLCQMMTRMRQGSCRARSARKLSRREYLPYRRSLHSPSHQQQLLELQISELETIRTQQVWCERHLRTL